MGLYGGVSSLRLGGKGRNYGFGDDEIAVSKFRFLLQIFGGGILLIGSKIPPPNGICAQSCGRHSCCRSVQALAQGRAASGGALYLEPPCAHWIRPE